MKAYVKPEVLVHQAVVFEGHSQPSGHPGWPWHPGGGYGGGGHGGGGGGGGGGGKGGW